MTLDATHLALVAATGLAAGVLGGLLGIGGSVIMIPALALLVRDPNSESQHLYQAAAMAVNVAVSFPAALRHRRNGNVRSDVFRLLLPSAACAIVLGVLCSNLIPGLMLRRIFAAFLAYNALVELLAIARHTPDNPEEGARVTPVRIIIPGAVMGLAAGLLGIGGGVIAIPLLKRVARLPLRQCIGASSAVMCLTAIAGGAIKIGTLGQHGYAPSRAVILAALLAPTAVVGGLIGAGLTQRLPLGAIRIAMIVLLAYSAWQMAGF